MTDFGLSALVNAHLKQRKLNRMDASMVDELTPTDRTKSVLMADTWTQNARAHQQGQRSGKRLKVAGPDELLSGRTGTLMWVHRLLLCGEGRGGSNLSRPPHCLRARMYTMQYAELYTPCSPCTACRYMAPEVYKEEAYNDKADVFSFSIIAYELLHRYQMISATDGSFEECLVSGCWRGVAL